jgi:hypothetical protein
MLSRYVSTYKNPNNPQIMDNTVIVSLDLSLIMFNGYN